MLLHVLANIGRIEHNRCIDDRLMIEAFPKDEKLMDFLGNANGSNPFGSLISDGTFLYGMTNGGGSNFSGTLFKIMPNGTGYTKLIEKMNWPKDMLHGTLNQCVVVTGRLSSSKPNLQNADGETKRYMETRYN